MCASNPSPPKPVVLPPPPPPILPDSAAEVQGSPARAQRSANQTTGLALLRRDLTIPLASLDNSSGLNIP